MKKIGVYGIGNPLMDILVNMNTEELRKLNLNKGVMHLVDEKRRKEILDYIEPKEKVFISGGDVPNTITALATLGIPAILSGKIGEDNFGGIYEKQLKESNVISDLKKGKLPTGSSIISISEDAERTMNTYLGACQHYNENDINEDLLKNSQYLYFTGYMWDTKSQKDSILKAIKIAKSNSIKVVFDVADPFAVKRNKEEFINLIKTCVNIVFANEEESKILLDKETPEEAIIKLSEICDIAVVKMGSQGALIKQKEETIKIPINKVAAIDSTGAGDTFAAGFIYGLYNHFSLEESGIFASYLASQMVTIKGARFSEELKRDILSTIKNNNWNYIRGESHENRTNE